ncbi:MAG: SDR family NAD(P)-dependent oxidoreductase [bacterium]|nr:SDR family NAD(P)-dependent oxidoreductase [bacterium]
MERLRDRIAVVTGGASGIGRGMAEAFASEGMKLVIADIETAALDGAVSELRASGATAIGVECDVSKADSVAQLAERTLEEYGAAHVICNNAGVADSSGGPIWEASLDDWDWVMGANLMGVIHGIRSFVPILLEQEEGHVVNTASIAGLIPGIGIYGVSKHACVALSETLWSGLQAQAANVGVSVLCPGWVATRIAESERNRPEAPRQPQEVDPEAEAIRKIFESVIAGGMDPAEVGRIVAEAVKERRFYVLPHRWENMVEARTRNIVEGRDPTLETLPGIPD